MVIIKQAKMETGEMAQLFRAHTIPAENLNLVDLSMYIRQHTGDPRGSNASGLHGHLHLWLHSHTVGHMTKLYKIMKRTVFLSRNRISK